MNSDGKVMVGYSGDMWFDFVYTGPFLWTPQLGTVPLDDFVKQQGTPMEQWTSLYSPSGVSDDGGTIAGVGLGYQYYGGWGAGHAQGVRVPRQPGAQAANRQRRVPHGL